MLRNVISGLGALALMLAFTYSVNAQTLCDYDCEGSTLCEVIIDGVPVTMGGVNFMDGTDPVDTAPNEKEVKIKCKELKLRDKNNQNKGTATNDENQESNITITSNSSSGVPFYPASAVVKSHIKLELNGRKYFSREPLVLKSVDRIRSWPSEEAVEYELVEDVTLVNENGTSKVTFQAGSTATMKARQ